MYAVDPKEARGLLLPEPMCAKPAQFNLRTKGIIALCVLFLYVVLVGLYLAHERNRLVAIVERIADDSSKQTFLTTLVNGLSRSLLETQAVLSSSDPADIRFEPTHPAARTLARIGAHLAQAERQFPSLKPEIDAFGDAIASTGRLDRAETLTRIRDAEQQLIAGSNTILAQMQFHSADSTGAYQRTQQRVNIVTVAAGAAGALVTAAVILIFFTKLAKDVQRLQDRAVAVVAGYDGEPLVTMRHDEIGGLIEAVNRMQIDLRRWEQKQQLSQQQRFHQEKMAAVGSLAAAIGHEVSNPIAAISGVAQFIIGATEGGHDPAQELIRGYATLIVKQTERIALIMRRMATLTDTRSADPELLDLNNLIESTCGFITFDARFADIALELKLDRTIPAVTAVPDHITQILMNLLINAADAKDPARKSEGARIVVATRVAGGSLQLSVSDNGIGMTPAVRSKAFEESFSTKPLGKGRGIGLFLCKTLIEEEGGRIELDSTLHVGTTVNLLLPLGPRRDAAQEGH